LGNWEEMMKGFHAALAASTMLCASPSVQAAEIEVIHWWTSGGEQAAVSILAEEFNQLGEHKWVDTAIAGGEAARATTMQRILGGDAPDAAQFNTSRQFEELIEADLLLDLTEVAEREGWRDVIRPSRILASCEKDGRVYCVPVNVHSSQWMWTNKKVFKDLGIPEPVTWEDFLAAAPKIKEAGIIPLAWGGQPWQEALVFDAVLLGAGGKDLYYKVYRDKDTDAVESPDMTKVVETFAALRPFVDEGSAGRNWNDATNLVITGKAAAQVMGDWARGEFALAGKTAEVDYGCIPGPAPQPILSTGGDSFLFPKQDDPDVEEAQLAMAAVMLDPTVQAKFNSAKGSLPVRGDVDLELADACMEKGLALLEKDEQVVEPRNVFVTSDTEGQIYDLVAQFWNSGDMSTEEFQEAFAEIIGSAY